MYQWFAKMYNAQQFILVSALLSVKSVGGRHMQSKSSPTVHRDISVWSKEINKCTLHVSVSKNKHNIKYGLCASTSSTVKSC